MDDDDLAAFGLREVDEDRASGEYADTPALARDAAGVTRLTDAEAAALAGYVALGWVKGESPPSFASDTDSDKDAEMLARYVLAVAPVVAAARRQTAYADEGTRLLPILDRPHSNWLIATHNTEEAVRALDGTP